MLKNKLDNNEFLKDLNIVYDNKNFITKDDLARYILNGISFKVKVFLTKDRKVVLTCNNIIKEYESKNIKINNISYDDYIKDNEFKNNSIILLNDLIKNTKGSVITYIEIIGNYKKHLLEREIIQTASTYGAKVVISAKSFGILKYFKKKAPSILRGIKYMSLYDDDIKLSYFEKSRIRKIKYPKSICPAFIEYDINSLPNNCLYKIRKSGILVCSGIIDTDAKMNKARVYADTYIVKEEM